MPSTETGKPSGRPQRRKRGFERASSLLQSRIRSASGSRGFAETRLLTHWAEVVGVEVAKLCRPVSVGYARKGFGATLTVLTTGAQAPMLQMQEPRLREKINAVYGYAAISRIRFTQTSPTGFAEGQAEFSGAAPETDDAPDGACRKDAASIAAGTQDNSLREALEALGAEVMNRSKQNKSE